MSLSLLLSTNSHSVTLDLKSKEITEAIREALPFDSRISTWGEEIYFPVPADSEAGSLTKDVTVGDVAFWHEGQSLAIFFGPTPMSGEDGQPVPADDVELVGTVKEGLDLLDDFKAGEEISVSLAE